MKTATALLRSAESLGIILWVEDGQLRYRARQPVSDGFKSQIKEHKTEIINLLTGKPGGAVQATKPNLPGWCKSSCEHYHRLELPDGGELQWCCQGDDERHWRIDRIDKMSICPMVKQR